MSDSTAFADLVGLTDALYQAEQMKLRDITRREARIRRALARLEESRKAANTLPATQLHPLRQIGADILWQSWLGRNRSDLNRELALCLARKARLISGLRRAHGKHMAARNLLENETAALRLAKDRQQCAQSQSLNIIRGSKPP